MEALEQRIRQDGRVLPGNIIKIDSFLNHQVDTRFLGELLPWSCSSGNL